MWKSRPSQIAAKRKPATSWPKFSLAHVFVVISVICAQLAAYQAWGIDSFIVTWLVAIGIVVAAFRYGRPVTAVAIFFISCIGMCGLHVVYVSPREPSSSRYACQSNLRMLALSTILHSSTHGVLPQGTAGDKNPVSWRVSILNELGEVALAASYNKAEPWDGPTNSRLIDQIPHVYRCPADRGPPGETNYVAIVGPDTCWPSGKRLRSKDLVDGASNTMLFTEMHDSGITWSEPRDLDADQVDWHINGERRSSPSSLHGPVAIYLDGSRRSTGHASVNVAMADGSVRTLSPSTDPQVLKQLANRHDSAPSQTP